jgi:hypothetical protein
VGRLPLCLRLVDTAWTGKKKPGGAFAPGFSLNRFYCMKLQFDLPNVCQKEKISPVGKNISFLTNFLLPRGGKRTKNPVKYCYLTGTKQKTNTMNK